MKLRDAELLKAITCSIEELWPYHKKDLLELRDAIDIMEKDEFYRKHERKSK